ncbi:hypothetical protein [Prauserella muralis]|nr:hypothetical protein [Prauserella muralis]TWE27392.1 hypothetical protein FHX69_0012 [Prauserella muralis]
MMSYVFLLVLVGCLTVAMPWAGVLALALGLGGITWTNRRAAA